MSSKTPSLRIGLYGHDITPATERHGCGLWMAGYAASVEASEAIPVPLPTEPEISWSEQLADVQGVVIFGHDGDASRLSVHAEALVKWCRENDFPVLGIDHGMHALNSAYNGTLYQDVSREYAEALQHRHPPERGLRHAINVLPDTNLAAVYGEGEIVVNSEHRRAIQRLGRCFRACATSLDGIVEAIESTNPDWFAMGIQWNPASATSSGLDIQVFRGLVAAAQRRLELVGTACAA
jgi:putative glutamine amidotransferase